MPSIALPKGGGAIRSIDEKFSVNAANGTAGLTVKLPASTTRSGLDGGLSLRYSSGAGNGAFALGWSLTLPSIQRRTDKQLPRYRDADDGDVFVFSDAEDLVPAYRQPKGGPAVRDTVDDGPAHALRYRPRVESAFARIERITVDGELGSYWKVTTPEGTVTVFGRTAAARIADPGDASRVFRWLPEWSYDDKGNCVEFLYKPEDLVNVPDVVEERNRTAGIAAQANLYLKRVRYGNMNPYSPGPTAPLRPAPPANAGYFFETVFDYGEHDAGAPAPGELHAWPCRFDPFSTYRAGFEIRTYRLCRRVLFFHAFAELDDPPQAPGAPPVPYLVRSVDFGYVRFHFDGAPYASAEADLLASIRLAHYRRTAPGAYVSKSFPPLELAYHELAWDKTVREIALEDVANAPAGVAPGYQWLDLDGAGVPGILTEQDAGWYYKRNLGDGRFAAAVAVAPKPSLGGVGAGTLRFGDLAADGSKQLISLTGGLRGYFELGDENEWQPFRAFERMPNVDFADGNTKLIDLNGDGAADLLISEEGAFRWYPSLGRSGYDTPERAPKGWDEERGPTLVFADGTETIFLADMCGDGLADVVRVRNGEVAYWPNLGYGRFGAKVTMRGAPVFDHPDRFDPRAIQLADVSGTGPADVLYLGRGGFVAWINLSGNALSEPQPIDPFPGTERPNRVSVMDLLGNGTASLVWSSELPANAAAPLRYVDLMGGRKPYLLASYTNDLGARTLLEYKSSSSFALRDRREGRPWVTKLPFPTMCVSRTELRDAVRGSSYVHTYRYRHGYYDHAEREFRGFGMVEETDAEAFERFGAGSAHTVADRSVHQPPVRTRTWYHTGAYLRGAGIFTQFASDYYRNVSLPEHRLPEAVVEADWTLTPEEQRQAARACKGSVLRREIYADDGTPAAGEPYSTAEHTCRVRALQPAGANPYAVFLVHESEALTYHYERHADDPRVTHELNTVIGTYGEVVESASVVYGRAATDASLPAEVQAEQGRARATYTVRTFTNDVTNGTYRLRQPCETRTYELTGATPSAAYFTGEEIRGAFLAAGPLGYGDAVHHGFVEARLTHHTRTLFASDVNPNSALPLQTLGALGLRYDQYRLAYTPALLSSLYAGAVTDAMLAEGGYVKGDDYKTAGLFPNADPGGSWWAGSRSLRYPANPSQHFYLPDRYLDAAGSTTTVRYYGTYHLLIDRLTDALGNPTTVTSFDFRVLQPQSIVDINDNISEAAFDVLGLMVGTALRGKGAEADDLAGFLADPPQAQIDAFFADPAANGAALLAHATSRFVYDVHAVPAIAASIVRETHHQAALAAGTPSALQYAFEYSDGLGRVAMKKVQAEPGKAKRCDVAAGGTYTITEVDTTPNRRWVGTGREILNNKGKRVMAYEPYFSATHAYEDAQQLVESGVTPVHHYDPIDRVIRTDHPDGTFSRVLFDAWKKRSYDGNDGVLASDWYAARSGGALGPDEQAAAQKTALHDDTPTTVHLDSLGHSIYTVEHNRFRDRVTAAIHDEPYATLATLDVDGNELTVRDPRGNTALTNAYDMLARPDHTENMESGMRRTLPDVLGKALYGWDVRGMRFHTVYDVLHRPVRRDLLTPAAVTVVCERLEYGTEKAQNRNGRLVNAYDGAGLTASGTFDLHGNALVTTCTFAQDYAGTAAHEFAVDWSVPAAVPMRPEPLTTTNAYDALSRIVATTTPDGSVSRPRYSEASLPAGLRVSVRGGPERSFIDTIEHDAKGRRTLIARAGTGGFATRFEYDPLTFRVRQIRTTRTSDAAVVQDLRYTYDPVGNVTLIRDLAQQTLYFNNAVVQPDNDFTYDACYRLVAASGREHVGQNAAVSQFDTQRTQLAHKADGTMMQNYLQQYEYDKAGNLTAMVHAAGIGVFVNRWQRQLVPNVTNNRLASSQVGMTAESYAYDTQGNLTSAASLAALGWDFRGKLRNVDLGGGGSAYYAYDAVGNRVRKVVRRQGAIVEERRYVGSLEIFTTVQGGVEQLRRETLHVGDGTGRVALVDSLVVGNDGTPPELVRYQFSNHLDSAALELDGAANVISYEEFYPYGSSSFQSVDASRVVPAKRYRYTGKERDEESGFSYHGARYCAPWLARWISPDPAGLVDGPNLYRYARDNPVKLADPNGTDPPDPDERPKPVQIGPATAARSPERSPHFGPGTSIDARTQLSVPDLSLSGPLSLHLDLDQPPYLLPGAYRVDAEGTAHLTTSLLPGFLTHDVRLQFTARGTATVGSGTGDSVDSVGILGETAHTFRGSVFGTLRASVFNLPVTTASFDANVGDEATTFTFRGTLPLSYYWGRGTISPGGDAASGRINLVSIAGAGTGRWSYDTTHGARLSAVYVGLLAGPTGLDPDVNPVARDNDLRSSGAGMGVTGGTAQYFSIGGVAAGISYIHVNPHSSLVISGGVGYGSVQSVSVSQPELKFPLSVVPGDQVLYGHSTSGPKLPYVGAKLEYHF